MGALALSFSLSWIIQIEVVCMQVPLHMDLSQYEETGKNLPEHLFIFIKQRIGQ